MFVWSSSSLPVFKGGGLHVFGGIKFLREVSLPSDFELPLETTNTEFESIVHSDVYDLDSSSTPNQFPCIGYNELCERECRPPLVPDAPGAFLYQRIRKIWNLTQPMVMSLIWVH